MERTLYSLPGCPDCEKVRLALALCELPYREEEVDREDRSEVVKISGQREVPVLVEEDGGVLHDANVILRRLAAREGAGLLPDGRRDQALTWILVERADGILHPLWQRLARKADPDGKALREDDLLVLRRRLASELGTLEGMLERGPFLFGDRPTVADVAIHAYLNRLRRAGAWEVPDNLIRVAVWFDRIETRVRGSGAAHG